MTLRTHDEKAAQLRHTIPQLNISTAACHVGGNGHGRFLTGIGNNLRFLLMELGIQHAVRNIALLQDMAELLRLGYGSGADQHRLPLGVDFCHIVGNCLVLGTLCFVNNIRMIDTGNRLVGRNDDYRQLVDFQELVFLCLCRTGHAGQLVVHAEIVLEGNGCQCLGLPAYLQPFLCLNCLMQAVRIAAPLHQAACKLVNDDNLAILDYIIPVTLHQCLGPQGSRKAVGHLNILRVVEVLYPYQLLNLRHSAVSRRHGLCLFVNSVVNAFLQMLHCLCHLHIAVGGLGAGTGDNQRCPRLINENAVHLVHDGEVQLSLHHLVQVYHHVVTEVIKAVFIIGTKGNITVIGKFALREIHVMADKPHTQSQEVIQPAHLNAVALCQVVIDCHHMHALACQGIQVGRQGSNQCLALTCTHLGNLAFVETDTAHHLHIKMTHAQHALGSLPDYGKGLRQNIVKSLTGCQPVLEFFRIACQ